MSQGASPRSPLGQMTRRSFPRGEPESTLGELYELGQHRLLSVTPPTPTRWPCLCPRPDSRTSSRSVGQRRHGVVQHAHPESVGATWRHIRIGECRSWPMVRRRLRARSTRCSTTSRTRATNHTGFLEQDLSRRQAKGRSVLARRSWATMLGDDDRPTAWSDASAFLADGAHDAAPVRSQLGPSPPHARELIDAGPGRAAPRARDGATRTARAASKT